MVCCQKPIFLNHSSEMPSILLAFFRTFSWCNIDARYSTTTLNGIFSVLVILIEYLKILTHPKHALRFTYATTKGCKQFFSKLTQSLKEAPVSDGFLFSVLDGQDFRYLTCCFTADIVWNPRHPFVDISLTAVLHRKEGEFLISKPKIFSGQCSKQGRVLLLSHGYSK